MPDVSLSPVDIVAILVAKHEGTEESYKENAMMPDWLFASVVGKYGVHLRYFRDAIGNEAYRDARRNALVSLKSKANNGDSLEIPVI